MNKKLIILYTGEGKGKTTAALGLAMRARGHDLAVCWISFFKDHAALRTGESKMLKKIGVKLYCFAPRHKFCHKHEPLNRIKQECLRARKFIIKTLKEDSYGLIVLDELNIALRDKLLCSKELAGIFAKYRGKADIVITGRGAPKLLIQKADMVTEMKKIRHPFDKGYPMRKGIEF